MNSTEKFYLVSPEKSESGALETLPKTEGLKMLKDTEIQEKSFQFNLNDKVCITSEASLQIVKDALTDEAKKNAINVLKDKYKFREIVSQLYPNYKFEKVAFEDIVNLQIEEKRIIKPAKGFFGIAVKTIEKETNLKKLSKEIESEIKSTYGVFSEEMLSQNEFVVEDYIKGEEYAVDMFYDKNGEPHIVNIYHHPMPRVGAYLHMLYYSSKEVFDKTYDKAITFFKKLNEILNVKNIVLHAEFKYDSEFIPVEINAMRYGGVGLGNLIYHSIGLNPYQCFKEEKTPNWTEIWEQYPTNCFAFLIAYNGTEIDKSRYEPNIKKLKKEFTEVLYEAIFDYRTQLTLGVFCLKETKENLKKILDIDFNDYFQPIK